MKCALIKAFGYASSIDKVFEVWYTLDFELKSFQSYERAYVNNGVEQKFKVFSDDLNNPENSLDTKKTSGYNITYNCGVKSFDAIISACFNCNRPDLALKFWGSLKNYCDKLDATNGLTPRNKFCFSKQLHIYNDGPPSNFIKLLKRHTTPLPNTIELMINYYFSIEDYKSIIYLWEYYGYNIDFEQSTLEIVILSYLKTDIRSANGEPKSVTLCQKFKRKGILCTSDFLKKIIKDQYNVDL